MILFFAEAKNMHPKTHLQLQERFGSKFVAQRKNQVIASASTLRALFTQLKKKHIPPAKDIIIGRIPPKEHICVY
jgi:hypothetical protein